MSKTGRSTERTGLPRRAWLAVAALAPAFPQGREPRSAPLVYDERGGLFLDARVRGTREVARFIVDTGASRSALSEDFARKLGLPLGDGGEVEGTAGTVEARAVAVEVEVPGLGVVKLDATVYAFHDQVARCVGIVGREVLAKEPFQLRYRDRRVIWGAAAPEETVPMRVEGGIPRIEATVNGVRLDLRIDTGATLAPGEESHVNLTTDQAARVGLTGRPSAIWSATGTGGKTLSLPVHALRSLRIGERELPRPFAIVQPKIGYFERPEAVGFLGNAVLDKLDPFLDYSGGKFGIGR